MLERLRKALFQSPPDAAPRAAPPAGDSSVSRDAVEGLEAWARAEGILRSPSGAELLQVGAEVDGLAWQLERGAPTRDFIHGAELRGRTDLGLTPDVAVLVLNRHLKDALESRAFAEFTDSLRTQADAQLPEEMRWLSMYDEVELPDAPIGFHDLYAVLAEEPEHARQWVTAQLASELLRWPATMDEQTPLILMVLRGKVYLRLEMRAEDPQVLAQACKVYRQACLQARASLPRVA